MKLSPDLIKFLRLEARKMYREMGSFAKRLTSEEKIYLELKKCWKAGNKLTREERAEAKVTAINFKELSKEGKEPFSA